MFLTSRDRDGEWLGRIEQFYETMQPARHKNSWISNIYIYIKLIPVSSAFSVVCREIILILRKGFVIYILLTTTEIK
jgi:hypothetical protein